MKLQQIINSKERSIHGNFLKIIILFLIIVLNTCLIDTQNCETCTYIISPRQGSIFHTGEDILVKAYAADLDGVSILRLWVDGNFHSSSKSEPYEFIISGLSIGQHTLMVRAIDSSGNGNDSETLSIVVSDDSNTPIDGNIGSWGNYTLNSLPYIRQNGFQDIEFSNSRIGTSEFLILSASHGNPPADQIKYPAVVRGGGWNKIVYAGNDDKSTEIWFRQITSANQNIPGEIDSKNAAAKISILAYNGILITGNIAEKNQVSKAKISITNSGTGPFLVVASSDNGGESDIANIQYGYKPDGVTPGDDMTFIYLTHNKSFLDSSVDFRGAIASIELKNN